MDNGVFEPTTVGTPQGGVVSPPLANIALNSLDWLHQDIGHGVVGRVSLRFSQTTDGLPWTDAK